VQPPIVCQACGASAEAFVCVGVCGEMESSTTFSGKIVIVGGGAAAISAAKGIREINKTAEIFMITQEAYKPYYRPSLSKLMAKPDLMKCDDFYLVPDDWYDSHNVRLILQTVVKTIDSKEKILTLETISDSSTSTLSYDSLILATGGVCFVPFREDIQFPHKKNVFSVRYLENVLSVHGFITTKSPKSCVVIGGGLAALEGAASLLEMGIKELHLVEVLPRILPRQLSELASKLYQDVLIEKGFKLHFGCNVKTVTFSQEDPTVATGVVLSTDETISTDMILFAIGTQSDVRLGKECGANVKRAIIVDEKMQTSVPGIFACGDCSEFAGVTIPNWTEAIGQGRVAGMRAAGCTTEIFKRQASPYLLNAFESVFSVGDVSDASNCVTMQRGPRELVQLFFKQNNMVGAIVFGTAAVRALQTIVNAAVNSATPVPLSDAVQLFSMF